MENRSFVNEYLTNMFTPIITVIKSLNPCDINENLQAKFQSYVDSQEQILRRRLETIRYDMDARETLTLVTGPGRIEKVGYMLSSHTSYLIWN